jgi:hypothetical protein
MIGVGFLPRQQGPIDGLAVPRLAGAGQARARMGRYPKRRVKGPGA